MRIASYEHVAPACNAHFFVVGVETLARFAGVLVAYGAGCHVSILRSGNEGQKICGDLSVTTTFKIYARNMTEKANMLIIPTYPRSAFSA